MGETLANLSATARTEALEWLKLIRPFLEERLSSASIRVYPDL